MRILSTAAAFIAIATLASCTRYAEPRWLVRALPGSYPEIVYFVPTRQRSVALTIDDGVDPTSTPAILDTLARHSTRATFFLVSESVAGHELLVQRILDEGHEIGHHMTRDEVTIKLSEPDLTAKFTQAAQILEGFSPITWFRPGSGRYNKAVLALTREHGYRIAMASVAPMDTIWANPGKMARFINRMVEPGSIVVLHDVGARGARTVQTLELLLPQLTERGFSVVSLTNLDSAGQGERRDQK
jgi:peptidoglycan/xylan/chitin deacetylase (PgdA/CDA1 family)